MVWLPVMGSAVRIVMPGLRKAGWGQDCAAGDDCDKNQSDLSHDMLLWKSALRHLAESNICAVHKGKETPMQPNNPSRGITLLRIEIERPLFAAHEMISCNVLRSNENSRKSGG
jgi:hypothetical protein